MSKIPNMSEGRIAIVNMKDFTKQMKGLEKASEKVLEATVKDFRARGPGWVAQEVTKRYNIKKTEIVPSKAKKTAGVHKSIGKTYLKGSTVDTAQIIYKGRVLTPVHFGMTPKAPKPGAYTLKVEIIKGQKKTLGKIKRLTKKQKKNIGRNRGKRGTRNSPKSPWMLSNTGNKQPGGVNYIPFQRQAQPGALKFVNRTVSLAQMVNHEDVKKGLDETISVNLGKRFDHHMKRFMPAERK